MEAAVDWCGDHQPGLGDDLIDAVEKAADLILEWPRMGPVFPGWEREPVVRSQRVEIFPYRVLYYSTRDELMIIAVAHNRRKPGCWKDRV